jgi:hypothetical protein
VRTRRRAARTFTREVEGAGPEVLDHRGPAADLKLTPLVGHPLPVTVDVPTEELRSAGRLTAEPPAAPADGLPVRPGALLAVSDPYNVGWSLEGR